MKKVVSATLAGALAVGMVPAMALAADDAIELQADTADVLNQGAVTGATVNDVVIANLSNIEFTAGKDKNGNMKQFVIAATELTPYKGAAVKVDAALNSGYATEYWQVENTNNAYIPGTDKVEGVKLGGAPTVPGTYYAVTVGTAKDGSGDVAVALKYVIKPASIAGVVVYEKATSDLGKGIIDTEFSYNGSLIDVSVALNGVKLEWNVDCTYALIKDGELVPGNDPELPGKYTLRLTGKGIYTGTTDIDFVVEKFDVNGLVYDIADMAVSEWAGQPTDADVIGLVDSVEKNLKLEKKSTPTLMGDPGSYTYVLKAEADTVDSGYANVKNSELIKGEQEITFSVYKEKITDFEYNKADITTSTVSIDLSDKEDADKLFDASKVKVFDADGKEIDSALYDIVVTNVANPLKPVPAAVADINTPGLWEVKVVVDPVATQYAMGGSSAVVTYDVTADVIPSATTYVTMAGEVIDADNNTFPYTGDDFLALVETEVKAGGKVLVEGSDYTVEVKNSAGKVVTEAVNADTYTVTLKSAKYDLDSKGNAYDYSVSFTVAQRALEARMVEMGNFDTDADANELAYTGKAIVPTFEYWVNAGADKAKGSEDDVWKALPAEFYNLVVTQDNKAVELKKVGDYKAVLTLTDAGAKNFTSNGITFWPEVTDYKKFQDVPNTKWFYDEVKAVTDARWMKGYGNGVNKVSFFGPYDTLKRGDAAVSIFRFAGHTLDADDGQISKIEGYDTDFSDVDAMKYWAEAILWASKSGIMTGYTGTDEFGPADALTRQQMVTVLWRYAELTGADMTADAAALAAYADADEVAGYAAEAMAWAVSNKIIGVDTVALNPANDVTRAEFAAMLVRFDALLKA